MKGVVFIEIKIPKEIRDYQESIAFVPAGGTEKGVAGEGGFATAKKYAEGTMSLPKHLKLAATGMVAANLEIGGGQCLKRKFKLSRFRL